MKLGKRFVGGCARKLTLVAAMAAAIVGSAMAEDVIVLPGQTRTLSGTAEYGRIFVNGTLSIADDANITATSFVMASGAVENVSFTLGKRAKFIVTGTDMTDCVIGMGEGFGTATLEEDSQMLPAHMCMCFLTATNVIPAGMLTLHLKPRALIKGGQSGVSDAEFSFCVGSSAFSTGSGIWLHPKKVLCTVTLDEDAALNFAIFGIRSQPYARINFNGGKLQQGIWNNAKTAMLRPTLHWQHRSSPTYLYLTSVDGNDIKLEQNTHAHYMVSITYNGSRIQFEGDGDVVFCGSYRTSPISYPGRTNALFGDNSYSVYFKNKGAVRIEGRRNPRLNTDPVADSKKNPIPANKVLRIGPEAGLDLNGYTITNAQLVCDGELYSLYTSMTGTMVVTGGATTNSTIANITTNIIVRKENAGSLSITTNAAKIAALDVRGGSVAFSGISNAAKTTTVERLSLAAGTSLASDGRTFTFRALEMDGTASAAVGPFAAAPAAKVAMTNFVLHGVTQLPFTYTSASGKANLDTWAVSIDGTACDPGVIFYRNHLTLGRLGMTVIMR